MISMLSSSFLSSGFLATIFCLILTSTSYDLLCTMNKCTFVFRFIFVFFTSTKLWYFVSSGKKSQACLVFSLYQNGQKLFSCKEDNSSDTMRCLHGIRSLSTAWVLLGHTFAFHIIMPIQNRIAHDTVNCICYHFHFISVHFLYFGYLIIELSFSICSYSSRNSITIWLSFRDYSQSTRFWFWAVCWCQLTCSNIWRKREPLFFIISSWIRINNGFTSIEKGKWMFCYFTFIVISDWHRFWLLHFYFLCQWLGSVIKVLYLCNL